MIVISEYLKTRITLSNIFKGAFLRSAGYWGLNIVINVSPEIIINYIDLYNILLRYHTYTLLIQRARK